MLFDAYLSGAARPFFGSHFADPGDRRRALRAVRPMAPAVHAALVAQNARFAPSPARDAGLAALGDGAAAVVTGQQVGLFGGPLFTSYKAATAIRCARALETETGIRVVPVFWLQSEDHDLPEIAVSNVPRPTGPALALRVPASPADRVSVAHRTLPPETATCLDRLAAELGTLPDAAPHMERLRRHYRPDNGWVAAFAGLLADLFPALVFIDPRDPALARIAAVVHRRALRDAAPLAELLTTRNAELERAGFEITVHVRPGAPLAFFHPDGPAGPRRRLDAELREVAGSRRHTLEALLAALEREPLSVSSSALLRPIVQDSLLPTAAYVGGPAEVGYFAQLAPLYRAFDLAMPVVVPRARFRLLEERTRRLLARLGVDADDCKLSETELVARATGGGTDVARALLEPFEQALAALAGELDAADCGAAVDKTRATVAMAVGKLAERYANARARKDAERLEAARRLGALLYPDGVPQERVHGLSWFAARFGEAAFVDRIVGAVEPFDGTPKDVEL